MSVEEQVERQVKLAKVEGEIEETKKTIVDIYLSALSQDIDDQIGIIQICKESFERLMTNYTDVCKRYGKLVGHLNGEL